MTLKLRMRVFCAWFSPFSFEVFGVLPKMTRINNAWDYGVTAGILGLVHHPKLHQNGVGFPENGVTYSEIWRHLRHSVSPTGVTYGALHVEYLTPFLTPRNGVGNLKNGVAYFILLRDSWYSTKDDEYKQRKKLWSYCRHPEHWLSDLGELHTILAIQMAVNSAFASEKFHLLAVRKVFSHINILTRLFWWILAWGKKKTIVVWRNHCLAYLTSQRAVNEWQCN